MNTRLISSTLLALSLAAAGPAMAADASITQAQPAAAQGQNTVRAMFAFADQNKDGQLTAAEAMYHLPITSANFDAIDTAHRGWISIEQFVAFTQQRGAVQAEQVFKVGAGH